ncbi:RICIN domain-containing protein [Streptomyces syringium]|uniref:RICIN domain-containing protein n=1 Tax=Streptomyces syringium TaxID=76729 RepID=UPI00343F38BB
MRAHPHRTKPTPNKEKWVPEWVAAERLRMRDAETGLCVETDPNVPNNGYLGLDLRACNGSRAQTWHVEPAAENTFRLRNERRVPGTEPCLDLDQLSANTGTDIVNVNQCERGRASQRWFFAPFDASAGPDEAGD